MCQSVEKKYNIFCQRRQSKISKYRNQYWLPVVDAEVDPSLVEDPINVVFLVLVEPLLVEKDAEVREKWEVDSVV